MDSARFDDLLRSVATGATRRGMVAGVIGGLLTALPFAQSDGAAEAKSKKRKRKKKRKKTASVPPAVCTPSCGGRTCGDDGCGGSCGACATGQSCLGNGSCATVCELFVTDCPSTCGCAASVEGSAECAAVGGVCTDVPQVCASTAACPPGQHCEAVECGPGNTLENRCKPLCTD